MIKTIINLITIYQNYLSPDHSPRGKAMYPYGYCRFYPSCSEYTKQALTKLGFWRGLPAAAWRILRCNPFSRPAIDQIHKPTS